jgi:hypothetical protein
MNLLVSSLCVDFFPVYRQIFTTATTLFSNWIAPICNEIDRGLNVSYFSYKSSYFIGLFSYGTEGSWKIMI